MKAWSLLFAASLALACSSPKEEPGWKVSEVLPSLEGRTERGLLDLRGLIHAHSVYSHDACDGKPEIDGVRNEACFEDFRRDLCTVQHDFVMLTDHSELYDQTEYPEALLYDESRGDELVERGGHPVASWGVCPDGRRSLILAGTESSTMPVGLEHHLEDRSVYRKISPEILDSYKEAGGVVLAMHTENWSVEELTELPFDGFEMYNLHRTTARSAVVVLELLAKLLSDEPITIHPDLLFLKITDEDPDYLSRWGSVLASGARRVTTMGTDCHRNTFGQILSDGERVDSYRRMMLWFSNHLLVEPEEDGSWDDFHLKEALKAGRLYGAFEVMGYPEGFDFHARGEGGVYEMGAEVALSGGPVLHLSRPSIRRLDPAREAPKLSLRVLKAVEGGFEEVASGEQSLSFKPTEAGAYRAEVRMVPRHLRPELGEDAEEILSKDFVWIYSNPIYVR